MRPEALAKVGFYPTPDSVVHEVADFLAPVGQGARSPASIRPLNGLPRPVGQGQSHFPEGVRILDPCCGEGDAAALLPESLKLWRECRRARRR